jgi:hypothetical protein
MSRRFLEPAATGLRKPTDPAQVNGNIVNQPRYADFGGLSGPRKTAKANPFGIVKPGGRR